MTKLNISALQMKAVSILRKHSDMKAVSKMLTAGVKFEKTDNDNVFDIVMKAGNEKATLVDDRFLVLTYAKPKSAKEQTLFLNKTLAMTALEVANVVVIDLENRTVENGLNMKGFALAEGSFAACAYMTGVEITAVRNYLNHTQVYFVKLDGDVEVVANIKAARQLINGKLATMSTEQAVSVATVPDSIPAEQFADETAVVA